MNEAIRMIAAERQRQIEKEGYTPEHDDLHSMDELAAAAACYAMPDCKRLKTPFGTPIQWPWKAAEWKPDRANRIRELVKAGALIVAEIERLQRVKR